MRQHLGLLLGFLIGTAALWPLRHRLARPDAPSAPSRSAEAGPAMPKPGPSPKAGPSYAGSLDLFVESNRKAVQGTSDAGDAPRVREGAVVAAPPKGSEEEPRVPPTEVPANDSGAAQAAVPAAEAEGGLMLVRLVAVGAAFLALLGTPVPAGAKGPSRALAACTAAAAAASLFLAATARLRGEGLETLAWLALSLALLALSGKRLAAG